jgi:SAM-dependent MidA family methyltransferase
MPTTPLQDLIIERIQREGSIPFADYMRMALYEPDYGYYVTGSARIGWEGDYFTSTDVSTLFAHCVGRQLYQMWEKLSHPAPFIVLEQGAGRGHLAQGVQAWATQEAPEFSHALDYRTEDISPGDNLAPLVGATTYQGVDATGKCSDTPCGYQITYQGIDATGKCSDTPCGYQRDGIDQVSTQSPLITPAVILSNELIDAFPVHIVEKHDGRLYEVYVDVQKGRLCEVLDEPSRPGVATYLDNYHIPWQTFEDGWRAEINLDALRWMERTAHLLRQGFVLTIDYGEKARELYTREWPRGTLLCYSRHQLNERPLLRPGEQDITAHVNFSALINEGRRHGLRLSKYTTQRLWLQDMGIDEELERLRKTEFSPLDSERATDKGQVALLKWYNLRQRVAALTDPAGMGNFKVLIQVTGKESSHPRKTVNRAHYERTYSKAKERPL